MFGFRHAGTCDQNFGKLFGIVFLNKKSVPTVLDYVFRTSTPCRYDQSSRGHGFDDGHSKALGATWKYEQLCFLVFRYQIGSGLLS